MRLEAVLGISGKPACTFKKKREGAARSCVELSIDAADKKERVRSCGRRFGRVGWGFRVEDGRSKLVETSENVGRGGDYISPLSKRQDAGHYALFLSLNASIWGAF